MTNKKADNIINQLDPDMTLCIICKEWSNKKAKRPVLGISNISLCPHCFKHINDRLDPGDYK